LEILGVLTQIYPKFSIFVLIFTRLFAFFYTFSMFRREMASMRLLITLSFVLSCYVLMLSTFADVTDNLLSLIFFLHAMVQFVIGFASGLIMNIILEVFSAIGQIISTQIGLSAASLFDPKFGVITSLTHFYVMVGTIIFLEMNGHLMMIDTLVKSFTALPVGVLITQFYGSSIASFSAIIFSGSILVSITVIAAVLMTNIAMAFISKFAPQFNLFSIGLNLTILIGLLCITLSFQIYVDHGHALINEVLLFFKHFIMGLKQHG
jgi:flagellar biosynthetic protein FliR